MTVIAITGATGFVGSTVLDRALDRGWQVRALTRRPQPERHGVTWVAGALDTPEALAELATGADAVIHIAGAVNAPDRAGFAAANISGTAAMVDAATRAGVSRFVHVSSLSAREPAISDYGWSKAQAEQVVKASTLDWTLVRPPAIYGPRDTEMFEMFRMAAKGFLPLPPPGRLSVIHVDDLVALLLALAIDGGSHKGTTFDPDDGRDGGWRHTEFAEELGQAVGCKVRTVATPRWAMRLMARADRLVRGDKAQLTPDRAAYFCHPDWVADKAHRPPPALWRSETDTAAGLAATAKWYRDKGWF